MTAAKLRARVRQSQSKAFWVIQFSGVPGVRLMNQFAPSWPEAMQTAYAHMAELDRALMNEVHASRPTRRERASQTITEYIENGHPTELEATA